MILERTMTGDVCVLTPKKNLTGGDETRQLIASVEEVSAAGVAKLVVDLAKISWVNSMGLAGLQRARLACVDGGTAFALANVGGRIKNLMLTTRLVILFDTYDSLEEALAAQESKA